MGDKERRLPAAVHDLLLSQAADVESDVLEQSKLRSVGCECQEGNTVQSDCYRAGVGQKVAALWMQAAILGTLLCKPAELRRTAACQYGQPLRACNDVNDCHKQQGHPAGRCRVAAQVRCIKHTGWLHQTTGWLTESSALLHHQQSTCCLCHMHHDKRRLSRPLDRRAGGAAPCAAAGMRRGVW